MLYICIVDVIKIDKNFVIFVILLNMV